MSEPASCRPVGIIVNPLSGRDVRRLAARAGTSTPEDKRNQVSRILVGAAAGGAREALLARDPFRIAQSAVAALGIDLETELLDLDASCKPGDTTATALTLRERGCGALVVLGGDGTNRVVAKAWPDAVLVPVSTGTNNVFPTMVEATMAGAAAGLVASGRVPLESVARRTKVVRVRVDDEPDDLALIDVIHLVDDILGNRMPYEPAKIRRVVVSRAEPCSVGISPVAGLLHPVSADTDGGVEVACRPDGDPLLVPISPGLYTQIGIDASRPIALDEEVVIEGPGLLAFDGDRERELAEGQKARVTVERNGPWVIDVPSALREAAQRGSYRGDHHWHDHRTSASTSCC